MGNKLIKCPQHQPSDFIIKFNKTNSIDNHLALCCKRVIFISLTGLYHTYMKCPSHVLYSALLILPLKKQWVYSPSNHMNELQSVSSGVLRQLDESVHDLLELIKWKDSQGLVFWAKDEHETSASCCDDLIHPFWQYVSHTLVSLYDPITSRRYQPLSFDARDNAQSMSDVLLELYFAPLKYESVKAILNASNPQSFRVLIAYDNHFPSSFVQMEFSDDSDQQSDDEWMVSSDYY
eukprot:494986_1